MKSYSPYQFAFFRIILGTYLLIHFVMLIPYAPEIWSQNGLLPDPSANLTYGVFPNILNYITSSLGVSLYIGLLSILSLCFIMGFQRQLMAVLLWYAWATLFDRNNLINNPGIPYVGWLLLCCVVIPKGEALAFKTKLNKDWQMPLIIFIGAWALMAIGYSISGYDKFQSPSWRDGSAIFHLLENPLARDWWLRESLLKLPKAILKGMSWFVLFLEFAFLLFAIFKQSRKWIWLAMIGMHLGILLIIDFADLTLGMLMIHFFTFDSSWLKGKPKNSGIVYFDGVCAMCNGFINFLMSVDKEGSLQYAPLQGETANQKIEGIDLENMQSVIYQEDGINYTEFDAIIKTMSSLGGVWKLIQLTRVVPKPLRNHIYKFVAKNRYKWFGKRDSCRLPTAEDRDRLLD